MKAIRLSLAALGTTAMGYAVWTALRSPDITPSHNGTFLVSILLLHDGLLLPLFLAAGALVHRFVPSAARAVVQAALIATASVVLLALPLVLGYGRIADNPSALPLNYARGLLLTLTMIWLPALAVVAGRGLRTRRAAGGPGTAEDASR